MARSEDADARAARWEREAHDLSTQVAFLQEELALVRRKLTENPRHVRQLEDRIVLGEHDIAVLDQGDLVHGQRARLVGAQDVHGSEILDRAELLDDHALA